MLWRQKCFTGWTCLHQTASLNTLQYFFSLLCIFIACIDKMNFEKSHAFGQTFSSKALMMLHMKSNGNGLWRLRKESSSSNPGYTSAKSLHEVALKLDCLFGKVTPIRQSLSWVHWERVFLKLWDDPTSTSSEAYSSLRSDCWQTL